VYEKVTKKDLYRFYQRSFRYGVFHKPLQYLYCRLSGKWMVEDQIRLACYCEPPMIFMRHGVMVPHAFGITLSVDEIGADCCIGHNVTLGTSRKDMAIEEGYSTGYKPRVGNLVVFYANAIVSGKVTIGDKVIVAAGAFVDRDIPPESIVYGHNKVKCLENRHVKLLQSTLYHCINVYKIFPGLVYRNEELLIDREYAARRRTLLGELENLIK
jgi:serine acetyltransferase